MQKLIRILAIAAAVLVGMSLVLLLFSIPFQSIIAEELFTYPNRAVATLPHFPLIPFLFLSLRFFCIAATIFCCGNKKGGIWLELAVFALLVIVIPSCNWFVSYWYNLYLNRTMGEYYLIASNLVANIANYCLAPASLGQALAYLACGMSIAFKWASKKRLSD